MNEHDILLRCAANCASAYFALADAMGRPAQRWDDLWAGDLGLPTPQSPNNATPLRPISGDELEEVLDRLRGFFAGPGGGYEIWSAWPFPTCPAEASTGSTARR